MHQPDRGRQHPFLACLLAACLGGLAAADAFAQQYQPPQLDTSPRPLTAEEAATAARLSVRPHEMATGAENAKAGLHTIEGLPKFLVYVPESCVGTKRVPLVVYSHGGGNDSFSVLKQQQQFADEYGMILLLNNSEIPGRLDVIADIISDRASDGAAHVVQSSELGKIEVRPLHNYDVKNIDAAMKHVLANYAIDPDRIAMAGFSDGGSFTYYLGCSNQDIFSRVLPLSGLIPLAATGGPIKPDTRFILCGSTGEQLIPIVLRRSQILREEGHQVESVLALRPHGVFPANSAYEWSWLADSWGMTPHIPLPKPADPESDTALTGEILDKMTAFWGVFMKQPREIVWSARMSHQKPVAFMLGDMPATVLMMDTPAMAAEYPSVAGALEKAGLTAEEHDAYRAAIVRAHFARLASGVIGPIDETTVLGKNLAFIQAHPDMFTALRQTGIFMAQ